MNPPAAPAVDRPRSGPAAPGVEPFVPAEGGATCPQMRANYECGY
jgi:hypothetical protein